MKFKTKEDLKKRLTYLWDFADKNSDIDALLNELWKDIEETKSNAFPWVKGNFESEKYGCFLIQKDRKKFIIWWDFEMCADGIALDPHGIAEETARDTWDCDVYDFSDMPKNGEFKTEKEAYEYIVKKFGEVK